MLSPEADNDLFLFVSCLSSITAIFVCLIAKLFGTSRFEMGKCWTILSIILVFAGTFILRADLSKEMERDRTNQLGTKLLIIFLFGLIFWVYSIYIFVMWTILVLIDFFVKEINVKNRNTGNEIHPTNLKND